MAVEAHQRFGRYELVQKLGQGGMAEVWKAKIRGIGTFERTLVVKRILPQHGHDAELVAMFMREAQVCSMLSHANIVQVFELGELDGEYYLAMEYVNGRDLHALVKAKPRTPPPPGLACVIARDICRALSYAYNAADESGQPLHIIHRDVTPSNVMVTVDGTVKLVDFGIAKALSRVSAAQTQAPGSIRGKLGYSAPEQLSGGKVDHRTDLFAVGIIVHELLTGRQLFQGDDDRELLDKVLEGPIYAPSKINPAVPPALDAIVLRALERDPTLRFQDGNDMADAFEAFVHQMAWGPGRVSEVLRDRFPELDPGRAPAQAFVDEEATRVSPQASELAASPSAPVLGAGRSLRATASFVRVASDMGGWSTGEVTAPAPSSTMRGKPVKAAQTPLELPKAAVRAALHQAQAQAAAPPSGKATKVEKIERKVVASPPAARPQLQKPATVLASPRSNKSALPSQPKKRALTPYVLAGCGIAVAASCAFVFGNLIGSRNNEEPASVVATPAQPVVAPTAALPPPTRTPSPPAETVPKDGRAAADAAAVPAFGILKPTSTHPSSSRKHDKPHSDMELVRPSWDKEPTPPAETPVAHKSGPGADDYNAMPLFNPPKRPAETGNEAYNVKPNDRRAKRVDPAPPPAQVRKGDLYNPFE